MDDDSPTTRVTIGTSRRRFLQATATAAVALASSGLLGACSQPAPSASSAPTSAPAGPATAGTRAAAGELKVSLPSHIVGLDPLGSQAAEESVQTVAGHLFDTLVSRDPRTGQFQPGLATSWNAPDAQTWVFTLRPGVHFHDGSPLTARDVKASLERLVRLKGPLAPLWVDLDTVEAPDDQTVRLKTKVPLGTTLTNAVLLPVLPADKMDAEGFFSKPIGSGPFKLASYRPDSETVLEANEAYWGPPPGLKTLRFREIPEIAARVTALITGEIDLTWGLPPDQLTSLQDNADLQQASTPSYRYYFIWMNAKRPPLNDPRVRQAMAHALDIDSMLKALLPGLAERMQGPVPSTVFGFAPQPAYAYDPARAKQLLVDAGVPNGFSATMIWNPDSGPQDREIAQSLLSYWNAIGIHIQDGQVERAQWLDKLLKLDWDLDLQTNGVITGDADFVLRRLYTTKANRMGYSNPELDATLGQAAQTADQEQRKTLYAQAGKTLWDEAVGIYPFELVMTYVLRKAVHGFVPGPSVPTFRGVTIAR